MYKIFFVIIIIFFPIFILLQIIEISTFDLKFYEKKYRQYNIEEVVDKDSEELMVITEDLLNYLRYKDSELRLKEEYSERDLIHLVDVELLFQRGFILKRLSLIISSIAIIFLHMKDKKYLYNSFFYSSILSLGSILVLFILYFIDFDKLFTYFHLLLFNNDYWILDPEKDFLIQIFPEGFFMDIFSKITLLFIGFMSIILIISYLLKERERNGKII